MGPGVADRCTSVAHPVSAARPGSTSSTARCACGAAGTACRDRTGDVGGLHERALGGVAVTEAAVGRRERGVDPGRRDDGRADALAAQLAVHGGAEVDLGALGGGVDRLLAAADEQPGDRADDDDVAAVALDAELPHRGPGQPDRALEVDVDHQPDLVGVDVEQAAVEADCPRWPRPSRPGRRRRRRRRPARRRSPPGARRRWPGRRGPRRTRRGAGRTASSRMSPTTTLAPASRARRAVAPPMPPPAPVTTTTVSCRLREGALIDGLLGWG